MSHPTITFIGAGNMGSSIVAGLIANQYPASQIWATDLNLEKLAELKEKYGIHTTEHNETAVAAADIIILAVKPQILQPVSLAIKNLVEAKIPLVISIAAGVTLSQLGNWLGKNIPIVRCMPNTPALLRCGATALYANDKVTSAQRELATMILNAVGITTWVKEEALLNVVTALSGSGPAYFFLMMDILQQAAVEEGLPSDIARLLVAQTALGSAKMVLETSESLTQLRQNVTSPGGTTAAALKVLESSQIDQHFKQALVAAIKRAEELAQSSG